MHVSCCTFVLPLVPAGRGVPGSWCSLASRSVGIPRAGSPSPSWDPFACTWGNHREVLLSGAFCFLSSQELPRGLRCGTLIARGPGDHPYLSIQTSGVTPPHFTWWTVDVSDIFFLHGGGAGGVRGARKGFLLLEIPVGGGGVSWEKGREGICVTWPQLGPFFVPACPPLTAINGH